MTADDVVFSFERQYNPDHWYHDKGEWAYWGYMFTDIESVEKIDTYTVAIHMKRPNASIMTSLAMFTACIVSEKAAKQYGDDYFKNPVGTGPFEFVRWVKDDQIELRAFQDYWRDPPSISTLIFKVITDPSARLMALQTGEVHGIEHVDPKQLDIIRDDPKLQLISQAGMNVGYIALNCGEGYEDANNNGKWDPGEEVDVPGVFTPFLDINVRRAIAHAINKDAIVRNLYQGAATAAVQGMPPVLFGYNDNIKGYEYDPAKAKDLLAKAGYPDGFEVTLWHMPVSRPYFPVPTEIAEAIQADLAAIGITATLITEDWGTYLQDTEAGKHQMAMLGWTGNNGDPDNFLNVLYSQDKAVVGAAGNIAFKKNPEFQALLDEALATFDQSKRAELYEEANELLVEQCSHVFIAHSDQNLGFLATVHGYYIHPTSRKFFYTVWIGEEEEEKIDWSSIAGEYEAEARKFEDDGDWKKAASTWEDAARSWGYDDEWENAAASWKHAARSWRHDDEWENAANAWEDAAEIWQKIARQRERIEAWKTDAANAWQHAARSWEDAGKAWKNAGKWENSVNTWQYAGDAWDDARDAWDDAGYLENANAAFNYANTAHTTAEDLQSDVEYEKAKLVWGQILFYVPQEMKAGVPARLKAYISKADVKNLPEVSKEYGEPKKKDIKVGTLMKACLKGRNFDIIKIYEDEVMRIPEEGFAEWEWDVEPSKSGSQTLTLTYEVDVDDAPFERDSIDKPIDVKINLKHSIQEFVKNYWHIITATITLIISSNIIRWIRKKQKAKKQKEVCCPNCGEKLSPDSKFCSKCGSSFEKVKKEHNESDGLFDTPEELEELFQKI